MAKIKIKGVIIPNDHKEIYEWYGMDATAPKDISDVLEGLIGEPIEVDINSGGGSVFAGSEIYTLLKAYVGKVTINIMGIAASAASVIAAAGDLVNISPTAQIMIHNVQWSASGDNREMLHAAEILENYNKSIANAYILKTGLSQGELLELMNKETWLNATQAKEKGFADEIMFDDDNKLVASLSPTAILPNEVINKTRSLINASKHDDASFDLKLKLINLKERKL